MQGPNALLNVITVPPGAGLGQRIVIDGVRGAIFEYDAGNNLVGSWASAAGTDPYGHAYAQGMTITAGSIIGSVFQGTDFIINNAGAFFYSAAPALGNLIASITRVSGTDTFGNVYLAGFSTYGVTYNSTMQAGLVQWLDKASAVASPPTVQAQPAVGGNILSISSGIGSAGHIAAQIQLLDSQASGANIPQLFIDTVGTGAIVIAEAPNSLGTLTGFTVSRGTFQMQTDGKVFFDIVLAGTGANALTVVFSTVLPAAYRPATTKIVPMAQTRTITAGDAFPRLQVGNTGNVTVFAPAININSGLHYQGAISLA